VGVAGYYLLLEAELLAMVQILVYVGAIAILIIFAVMLSRRLMSEDYEARNEQWVYGLGAAIVLFGILAYILLQILGRRRLPRCRRRPSCSWASGWSVPSLFAAL
jgi:NADH-quinone oxidoreductase subunit J